MAQMSDHQKKNSLKRISTNPKRAQQIIALRARMVHGWLVYAGSAAGDLSVMFSACSRISDTSAQPSVVCVPMDDSRQKESLGAAVR